MLVQLCHRLEDLARPTDARRSARLVAGQAHVESEPYPIPTKHSVLRRATREVRLSRPLCRPLSNPLYSPQSNPLSNPPSNSYPQVPKSGEVWCEAARCLLNPMHPAAFDLRLAQRYLGFGVQFTPQVP